MPLTTEQFNNLKQCFEETKTVTLTRTEVNLDNNIQPNQHSWDVTISRGRGNTFQVTNVPGGSDFKLTFTNEYLQTWILETQIQPFLGAFAGESSMILNISEENFVPQVRIKTFKINYTKPLKAKLRGLELERTSFIPPDTISQIIGDELFNSISDENPIELDFDITNVERQKQDVVAAIIKAHIKKAAINQKFFKELEEWGDNEETWRQKIDEGLFPKKDNSTSQLSKKQDKKGTLTESINPPPMNYPLNTIFYGPPGTGKTYLTISRAVEIAAPGRYKEIENSREEVQQKFRELAKAGNIAFTTFHQSFSYEDFIEGIKPETTAEGKISYKVEDGLFKIIADKAGKKPDQKFVLIIDEINRGNISQIFGELITLIEDSKRWETDDKNNPKGESLEITLPYSKKPFFVPKNLYILGTMNTADRSVEAMDSALRRRFSFEEMPVKYDKLSEDVEKINVKVALKTINNRLEYLKDKDHTIGHAYFINCKTKDDIKHVFLNKVIPLLQEYFYGDYEKIQWVLGEGFIRRNKWKANKLFAESCIEKIESEKIYFSVEQDCDIDEAIRKLLERATNGTPTTENDGN